MKLLKRGFLKARMKSSQDINLIYEPPPEQIEFENQQNENKLKDITFRN
jgi:hypothetical protein